MSDGPRLIRRPPQLIPDKTTKKGASPPFFLYQTFKLSHLPI